MKKLMLVIMLANICAAAGFAQETRTSAATDASTATSVSSKDKSLNIQSGTRLAAQLESTIDARKARVGDRVMLKTTEAIKENGRTVVKKGARLVGRVTEVQKSARARGTSSVSLVFDRLESGSLTAPISATITSVTQARTSASMDDRSLSADSDVRSSTSARTTQQPRSGNSGGLLGGATNTVGGVVGTTTQTVGSTVNATGETVGNTVGGVTNSIGAIQISQSSSASVEGSTTLSLTGDNLRLEKGTTFRLTLNQAANIRGNQ